MSQQSNSMNINRIIGGMEHDLLNKAKGATWAACQNLREVILEKTKEIIAEKFYQAVPKSDYYDRTYSFLESPRVKITQGGGHYRINLFYDVEALPSNYYSVDSIKRGKFLPYAYSFEPRRGDPLEDEIKQDVVYFLSEQYGIENEVQNWFDNSFEDIFIADVKLRVIKALETNFNY